jgi:hypothetical protein
MLQPGWYRTTGGDLVCLQQWPGGGSGGQVNWGRVVNVGSFYYDDEGRVLKEEGELRPGLDLDRKTWRAFQAVLDGKLCKMHHHHGCVACSEGYVPILPDRIQTGDIVRMKQGGTVRIRVTTMSLDGQGGSFEVIKKDGTADRRYERWSGGFSGYELIEKEFSLQGRGTQENIRVANEQEEKEKR